MRHGLVYDKVRAYYSTQGLNTGLRKYVVFVPGASGSHHRQQHNQQTRCAHCSVHHLLGIGPQDSSMALWPKIGLGTRSDQLTQGCPPNSRRENFTRQNRAHEPYTYRARHCRQRVKSAESHIAVKMCTDSSAFLLGHVCSNVS